MCNNIIPPIVINPPRPLHLNGSNKPITVLMGNRSKAIISDLLIAVIFESVNNSPIVIKDKNIMTRVPNILAAQRIIFNPFSLFKIVSCFLSCSY